MFQTGEHRQFQTVIFDEFTNGSTWMCCSLSREQPEQNLIVMSATIAAERLARFLNGHHLEGSGRTYAVEITYQHTSSILPDAGPRTTHR